MLTFLLTSLRFIVSKKKSQHVSMRPPTSTPHDRGVGDFLEEEGRKVWAIMGEFGLVSGLGAVSASLLGVREANGYVKGGVGVAQGREHPQVASHHQV